MDIFEEDDDLFVAETLQSWVDDKCQKWANHYTENFQDAHEEYYRLWRCIWADQDKMRQSERSKIISPALQQAVESNVAEIETACFSANKMFDIEDDKADQTPGDVTMIRDLLHEDMDRAMIRPAIGECLINAAVYGTGIGELVIDESVDYVPATREIAGMEGTNTKEFGVQVKSRPIVRLNPIQPNNFRIDPAATSVTDALGVCIEEQVAQHHVDLMMEKGIYRTVSLSGSENNADIESDTELTVNNADRYLLRRYYGLVPRHLLKDEGIDDEEMDTDSELVEAIVVTCEGELLKATPTPYMCKDRPIIAFSWDSVPSRFWGRGVCEKGYWAQKSLDAELRARADALALTTHPMMAMDGSAFQRNSKFEVKPGKLLLTNGAPRETLMPLNFGQVDQITFSQASALQMMVQQATGAVDGAQMAQGPSSDTTAAGMSMSMGAVMKRQRRTLVNFQDQFFRPLIKKMAWRYMQFDPEHYPVSDYKFTVVSSLGVIAREYEVGQLSQILQVVPPESPLHQALIKSVVQHLNISDKEQILQIIEQAGQPSPEQQQQQQAAQQAQMEFQASQTAALQAQAQESQMRAAKYRAEADLYPQELILRYADSDNDGRMDSDLDKRLEFGKLMLEEKRLDHEREQAQAAAALEQQKAQQEAQNKQQERDQLQQIMQANQDSLAGVTFEGGM